jgi:hypothetical protein
VDKVHSIKNPELQLTLWGEIYISRRSKAKTLRRFFIFRERDLYVFLCGLYEKLKDVASGDRTASNVFVRDVYRAVGHQSGVSFLRTDSASKDSI